MPPPPSAGRVREYPIGARVKRRRLSEKKTADMFRRVLAMGSVFFFHCRPIFDPVMEIKGQIFAKSGSFQLNKIHAKNEP